MSIMNNTDSNYFPSIVLSDIEQDININLRYSYNKQIFDENRTNIRKINANRLKISQSKRGCFFNNSINTINNNTVYSTINTMNTTKYTEDDSQMRTRKKFKRNYIDFGELINQSMENYLNLKRKFENNNDEKEDSNRMNSTTIANDERKVINSIKIPHISSSSLNDFGFLKCTRYGREKFDKSIELGKIINFLKKDKERICEEILGDIREKIDNCGRIEEKAKKNFYKLDKILIPKVERYCRFLRGEINKENDVKKELRGKISMLRWDINKIKGDIIRTEKIIEENLNKKNFLICLKERTPKLPEEFLKKEQEGMFFNSKKFNEMKERPKSSKKINNIRKRSVARNMNHGRKSKIADININSLSFSPPEDSKTLLKYSKYLSPNVKIFSDPIEVEIILKNLEERYRENVKIYQKSEKEICEMKKQLKELEDIHKKFDERNKKNIERFTSVLGMVRERNRILRTRLIEVKFTLLKANESTNKNKNKKEKDKFFGASTNPPVAYIRYLLFKQNFSFQHPLSLIIRYLYFPVYTLHSAFPYLLSRIYSRARIDESLKVIKDPERFPLAIRIEKTKNLLFYMSLGLREFFLMFKKALSDPKNRVIAEKKRAEIENRRRNIEAINLRNSLVQKKKIQTQELLKRKEISKFKIKGVKIDYYDKLFSPVETGKETINEEGIKVPIIAPCLKSKKGKKKKRVRNNEEEEFFEYASY